MIIMSTLILDKTILILKEIENLINAFSQSQELLELQLQEVDRDKSLEDYYYDNEYEKYLESRYEHYGF